jgi:hypothetical protein
MGRPAILIRLNIILTCESQASAAWAAGVPSKALATVSLPFDDLVNGGVLEPDSQPVGRRIIEFCNANM